VLSAGRNKFLLLLLLHTSVGNGQWLRKSLDIRSVSAGGFTATKSDPTLNVSLSRPSSFDKMFGAREEPCNHSRSAARTLELGASSIAISRWSISASSSHRLVLEKKSPNYEGRMITNSTSSVSRPKIREAASAYTPETSRHLVSERSHLESSTISLISALPDRRFWSLLVLRSRLPLRALLTLLGGKGHCGLPVA
jgi:hypothetical protein